MGLDGDLAAEPPALFATAEAKRLIFYERHEPARITAVSKGGQSKEGIMHAREMLNAHSKKPGGEVGAIVACIEACYDCAQTCEACADACLAVNEVAELRRCIRLNLDCADICAATGAIVSRHTEPDARLCRSALEALHGRV